MLHRFSQQYLTTNLSNLLTVYFILHSQLTTYIWCYHYKYGYNQTVITKLHKSNLFKFSHLTFRWLIRPVSKTQQVLTQFSSRPILEYTIRTLLWAVTIRYTVVDEFRRLVYSTLIKTISHSCSTVRIFYRKLLKNTRKRLTKKMFETLSMLSYSRLRKTRTTRNQHLVVSCLAVIFGISKCLNF